MLRLCKETRLHQTSGQKNLQWEEGGDHPEYYQVQKAHVEGPEGPAASPHLVPQFPLSKAASASDFLCALGAKSFLSQSTTLALQLSFVLITELKFPTNVGRAFRTD